MKRRGKDRKPRRMSLSSLANLVMLEPLGRHEEARKVYIRASRSTLTAFERLSPLERGTLLKRALEERYE